MPSLVDGGLKTIEPEREADGRNAIGRAEQRQQPVETTAAGQHRGSALHRHLEDEAGVIIERTAEGGAIGDDGGIDAGIADRRHARIEARQGGCDIEAGALGKGKERGRRLGKLDVEPEEIGEQAVGAGIQTDAFQLQLLLQPAGDFGRAAAGIGGIACCLHGGIDMGGEPRLIFQQAADGELFQLGIEDLGLFGIRERFQQAGKMGLVAEGMDQPLLPAGRQAAGGHHRLEHALVTQRDGKRLTGQPAGENVDGIRHGTGIGAGDIGVTEILDAGLIELGRALAALAEHFAQIGVALRRAGGGLDVAQADGNGEFRAQAEALARLALRQEDARRRSSPAMSRKGAAG